MFTELVSFRSPWSTGVCILYREDRRGAAEADRRSRSAASASDITARSRGTSVVVQELFAPAQCATVFAPLARRTDDLPELRVRLFLEVSSINQVSAPPGIPSALSSMTTSRS